MELTISDRIRVHTLAREMITCEKNWMTHLYAVARTTLTYQSTIIDHTRPERMDALHAEFRALFELKFVENACDKLDVHTRLLNAQFADIRICLNIPEHIDTGTWADWSHESTLAGLDATIARLKYQVLSDGIFEKNKWTRLSPYAKAV